MIANLHKKIRKQVSKKLQKKKKIASHNQSGKQKDLVVLIHGLARSSRSMKLLSVILEQSGYETLLIDYPSRKKSVEAIVEEDVLPQMQKLKNSKRNISFVTHSMGAIILRYYLTHHNLSHIGKVIMLTPPNRGSKFATTVSKRPLTNEFFGPALKQLRYYTDQGSIMASLGHLDTINCPIGVIAVDYDVSVQEDEAKVDYMTDYVHMPGLHSFVMYQPKVISLIKKFLETAKFS